MRLRWLKNRAFSTVALLGFLSLSLTPAPWSEGDESPAVCRKSSGIQQAPRHDRSPRLDPRSPYARHGIASCHAVALDMPAGIVVAGRLEYCAEFTKPDSLRIRLLGTPKSYRSPPA